LNHQLIGRLNTKRLWHGYLLTMGLPSVIRGQDMVPTMASAAKVTTHWYTSLDGSLIGIFSML
jgi:hypothetical protein